MKGRFMRAFRRLPANQLFTASILYFLHIYQISESQFEKKYPTQRDRSGREYGSLVNGGEGLQEDARMRPEISHTQIRHSEQDKRQSFEFPRIRPSLRYYSFLSTGYMTWVMIRNSGSHLLQRVIRWLGLSKPPNCYLLGHLVLHDAIGRQLGLLVCFANLSWRLVQHYSKRSLLFGMCIFLCIPDADIKRFIRTLDELDQGITRPGATNPHHHSSLIGLECLLRDTLCYKVQLGGVLVYKLKPNRTLQAQRQLRRRAAQTVYYASLIFAILFFLNLANFIIQIIDDERYLRLHPGCDADVEPTSRPVSWGGHRTLSLVADFIESAILWIDSGLSTLSAWSLVLLLNYDNLLYWRHLHKRLRQVQCRVRADFESGKVMDLSGYGLRGRRRLTSLRRRHDDVYELHTEFFDFFNQIGQTDLIISDVVTLTVAFCLASMAVLGHFALRASTDQKLIVTMVGYLMGLAYVIVTVGSFSILNLHNSCLKSYQTLCSMMAYDQSPHKKGYSKVISFFTDQKRSMYTLCRHYPYKKTTYLSIFGWALTGFLIFGDLLRNKAD